jgi:uncharacterized protein YceK
MRTRILLNGLVAAVLSGCGTSGNHGGYAADRRPYGGVVTDYQIGTRPLAGEGGLSPGPLMFLDMPFSFVGDTLLLPSDLYYQHQVRAHQEFLRRFPLDPDPLAGWKHTPDAQPSPAIVTDYHSYIEQLPPDQRKELIVNDYMVRLFESGKGFHAMEIRLLLKGVLWKHVLIYDESNRRVKVMRFANGYLVP